MSLCRVCFVSSSIRSSPCAFRPDSVALRGLTTATSTALPRRTFFSSVTRNRLLPFHCSLGDTNSFAPPRRHFSNAPQPSSSQLPTTPSATLDTNETPQKQTQPSKESEEPNARDDHFAPKKSKRTPLTDYLIGNMKLRGPMSISSFMREALTNPYFGYYMRQDVIGRQGDFITSPEISQIFGELIGIFCVHTWIQMGEPKKLHIVELGPGKGTLMQDLLRAGSKFEKFMRSVSVDLVEVSSSLRQKQAAALQCEPLSAITEQRNVDVDQQTVSRKGYNGIQVNWHTRFDNIQFDGPMIVVAHEFFDALPIHQLEYTKDGWRERLVDLDLEGEEFYFRLVLSPSATLATQVLLNSGPPLTESFLNPSPGDSIEVSPEALAVTSAIGSKIEKHGGCALVIDYGDDSIRSNTLRGIKGHSFCNVFEEPGNVDLSADVDFSALKFAANKVGVDCLGPVTQGDFLMEMGIEARLISLLKTAKDDAAKEDLIEAANRLVDPEEMGRVYKVLCIKNKSLTSVAGFVNK